MELKTAIEILEYHQEWRLGKRDDMTHEPKKLTEALDIVLREVKRLQLHLGDVISSVCNCEEHSFYEWEENECIECGKPIYITTPTYQKLKKTKTK